MRRYKRLVTITAALALIALGEAKPSLAAEKEAAKSKPAEIAQVEKAVARTISGTVTAVVPDANTLVVAVPKGKSDTLVVGASVTDQTVIKKGKTKKRLADLEVGNHVWMRFERVSFGDIAQTIVVKRAQERN